ncbi:hypothetical protein [Nocardia jinanensis]|uniref:Uncharacterized protein n=1 Tax=Nocardia jinanensis TaxID=382504 RepID=A0A917VUX3_9NOCA|nr:hypothetical protein [Nocardia jinanensis]GGL20625.1 hypothetical protein GCM10011588_39330 [Nocardia jinanensis]
MNITTPAHRLRTEPLPLCRLVHRVFAEYEDGTSICLGALHTDGHQWQWVDKHTGLPASTDRTYDTAQQAAAAMMARAYPAWQPPRTQPAHTAAGRGPART